MVIIFPLIEKLNTLFMQQRPKWTGGRRIPALPTLPWNVMNRPAAIGFHRYNLPPIAASTLPKNFGLVAAGLVSIPLNYIKPSVGLKPSVVHPLKPMPATVYELTGVSKDNAGSPLGSCTMSLFRVDYDSGNNLVYTFMGSTVSDASGNYVFVVNTNSRYRVVADNSAGTLAGVSLNTLTGVNA